MNALATGHHQHDRATAPSGTALPGTEDLSGIVDLSAYPLTNIEFGTKCRASLTRAGALRMPGFLLPAAIEQMRQEGEHGRPAAYYCTTKHNVYLSPSDSAYAHDHPRNRQVESSKGCITDDVLTTDSTLRALYDSPAFRQFLCTVLEEKALYPYADPLSSVNIHYASEGQELGWHFDNSSFAVTLMIEAPMAGAHFEYVRNLRDARNGDMNFEGVRQVLDARATPMRMEMAPGTLLLFRGLDAMHRVTPVEGHRTRMLAVLAYNTEPDVALSESARMTFYGRLG